MEESDVPPQPKLTRSRSKKVEISDEPEIKAIPPRPRSRSRPPPKPEPTESPTESPVEVPVKKPRIRKKPEPGSRPPKEVSFTSAKGPINFTAHRVAEPYGHLHGANRFSAMMAGWEYFGYI